MARRLIPTNNKHQAICHLCIEYSDLQRSMVLSNVSRWPHPNPNLHLVEVRAIRMRSPVLCTDHSRATPTCERSCIKYSGWDKLPGPSYGLTPSPLTEPWRSICLSVHEIHSSRHNILQGDFNHLSGGTWITVPLKHLRRWFDLPVRCFSGTGLTPFQQGRSHEGAWTITL